MYSTACPQTSSDQYGSQTPVTYLIHTVHLAKCAQCLNACHASQDINIIVLHPIYTLIAHLFASSSAHTFSIFCRFSLATSRFLAVFSSRCARRHMFTLYFASVQFPVTFQRKPRAWHSSRAATTSAQSSKGRQQGSGWCKVHRGMLLWQVGWAYSFALLRCGDGDAL